jgi:hypothetical protein
MIEFHSDAPFDDPAIMHIRKRQVSLADYQLPTRIERTDGRKPLTAWRNASPGDVTRLFTGNWLFWDDDADTIVMAYLEIPDDCAPLIPYLQRIRFRESDRTSGVSTRARVVGYLEPNRIRQRDFCTISGLGKEDPEVHAAILHYAAVATAHYQRLNPELYALHMAETGKVLEEYRVEDTPFTSGIVNRDNVLAYHYDSGNIRNVWSLMLGFKRNVEEGFLVVPEYDLALEVADNTLSGFDGQVALHGVSPFKIKPGRPPKTPYGDWAYRFTIVYYAKVGMWQCLPEKDEARKAKLLTTKKMLMRYDRDRAATPS